ncbi:fumarylacetoacetate hydrolase family protein [Saliterribacillus persicus]|uniref:2-keto-4-pentenoate hydratase/2-oxohepta-3-ene-1,7-dioic acid hydratase in catechol pathway n=1 Tax=Saliterribacillus persicus TaxID=930114 RepID=A0A368XRN5_9BACI|nr:fumarylacetoacetate hydrolase family protein [Saliterribacillus persicus]RCW69826.1 2-keto-4-pentenoate hydratase/2-oxohepta-3-ene-1,7-dioic acid hydratase in catechol pathway [Saliterribacillus persicus]
MKLATVYHEKTEKAAIVHEDSVFLIETLNEMENKSWATDIFSLIETNKVEEIENWYKTVGKKLLDRCVAVDKLKIKFAPLYRSPRKIWGVGLNYTEGKTDLKHISYQDPVSFMKPDTTIIGPNDAIHIPKASTNTTAEAELAIIIGKSCRDINEEQAKSVIAGYTTALDMTEADIHAENHRYLTRAKSFDTFFSFGPEMITPSSFENVDALTVKTVQNEKEVHQNKVENMRFNPFFIIAFHSKVMTLLPGDIILTGTPGATVIRDGDLIEAHITGFSPLINTVIQTN